MLGLVVSLVIAFWYAQGARSNGRNWLGWALIGFVLFHVVYLAASFVVAFALTGGTLRTPGDELRALAFGLGAALVGIACGSIACAALHKRSFSREARHCSSCGVRNRAFARVCKTCGAELD